MLYCFMNHTDLVRHEFRFLFWLLEQLLYDWHVNIMVVLSSFEWVVGFLNFLSLVYLNHNTILFLVNMYKVAN